MDDSNVGAGGGQRVRHPRLRDLRGVQGLQEHSEPAPSLSRPGTHNSFKYHFESFRFSALQMKFIKIVPEDDFSHFSE